MIPFYQASLPLERNHILFTLGDKQLCHFAKLVLDLNGVIFVGIESY